jgi:catechol 2,3-dioxygenase-like lactoylglutathione lyase family enzyme
MGMSTDTTTALVQGVNHVAVLTEDLDRFTEFYRGVFDAEVLPLEGQPGFQHALVLLGAGASLHPVQIDGNPHAKGLPDLGSRGHLDHLGINAADEAAFFELRRRLVERGATDGAISDLGPALSVWFQDPDGMGAEVCWQRGSDLRALHAPVPYEAALSAPDD